MRGEQKGEERKKREKMREDEKKERMKESLKAIRANLIHLFIHPIPSIPSIRLFSHPRLTD